MLTFPLSTDSPLDPALTARTFLRNATLTDALDRLAARASVPVQAPAPLISGVESPGSDAQDNTPTSDPDVPLAIQAVGASPVTVRCPWCNQWARPDGNRFYHLEVKSLFDGTRDDTRSLWCEFTPAPTEDQLQEQYLVLRGWERLQISETRVLFSDPYTYDALSLEDAHQAQELRDRAFVAPTYSDCNLIV